MLTRVLVLLFAVCAAASAQTSQPPTPGRPAKRAEQQKPAQQIQSQPPIAPPSPAPAQITIQQTNKDERASSDNQLQGWVLGLLTVAVGALQWRVMQGQRDITKRQNEIIETQTGIMAGQKAAADVQSGHMHDGLVETRKAIEIAQKSADTATKALLLANRPRLVVRHITITGIDIGEIGSALTGGYAWVVNSGTAPVRLFKVYTEWLLVDKLPLTNPALNALDNSDRNVEIKPAAIFKIELPDKHVEGLAEHAALWVKPEDAEHAQLIGKLYLVGYIKYTDSLGLRRRYFCYRYDPQRNRFRQVRHPGYNYED